MDVTVYEVGPRDGLQSEKQVLTPEIRAELVNRLVAAGVRHVEAASFVHPRLVPTMAGAEVVFDNIVRRPGRSYSGLVLNEKGYERALDAGVDEVRYAFAVTDEFGLRNQSQTTKQGFELAKRLIRRARLDGKPISVTLSVAFGCPFTGRVAEERVRRLIEGLATEPPNVVLLADTIGVAVPAQVRSLVRAVCATGVTTGAHFHNTRNTGYVNALAAIECGATIVDASVGGVGGCPFAPGATGNIATEDLVYLLHGMGLRTGIKLAVLIEASDWLSAQLGKPLPGLLSKVVPFPKRRQR